MKSLSRMLVNFVFRTGKFNHNSVKAFARNIKNKKILELGSGRKENNTYPFSLRRYFDPSNNFTQSDIFKEYGHSIVDITKMSYKNTFDIILCTNVLEHVFDFQKAIVNLYAALKPKGTAVIFVPVFYPLHDEPYDYWRYTEHSLRRLLNKFRSVKIKHYGLRRYPFAYYVEAVK